ncbi:hypothetical protein RUND412_001383, partial [Rhizina undulata]
MEQEGAKKENFLIKADVNGAGLAAVKERLPEPKIGGGFFEEIPPVPPSVEMDVDMRNVRNGQRIGIPGLKVPLRARPREEWPAALLVFHDHLITLLSFLAAPTYALEPPTGRYHNTVHLFLREMARILSAAHVLNRGLKAPGIGHGREAWVGEFEDELEEMVRDIEEALVEVFKGGLKRKRAGEE